jgi:hypothetical protein
MKGRIGIAFAPSDPRIIYTMVEAEAPAGQAGGGGGGGGRGGRGGGPGNVNGLYRSNDGGQTWERMNSTNSRPFYYSQVRVDPEDPERVYFSSFEFSTDGGRTVRGAAEGVHVDHHAQWIDPNDPNRFITGNDGGIALTFDRGGNYIFPNSVPLGQFYNISHDMAVPYRVCGGLQESERLDHEPRLVPRQRRRRVRHTAGSSRPEHHLFGVAGRQHRQVQLRDR